MPITLDPSLPPSLYPLAWLVGTWEGSGAVHLPGDGSDGDRRIEQRLECVPREDGTLQWTSRIHVIDDPAPLPPTSVFSRDEAGTAPVGTGERSLLMREDGIWTVGEPLPGQDLRAAREAEPGSEQSLVSYAVTAHLTRDEGTEEWAGEVRGPRIQLARRPAGPQPVGSVLSPAPAVDATRMFGYVGGRLMWLWERRPTDPDGDADAPADLAPYLSLELDRV